MKVSEITLPEAIEKVNGLSPIKIMFNGIVLYNDYDSDIEIEDEVYGENKPPLTVIPNRLWQFDKYVVTSIIIDIVEYHHTVIEMYGEYNDDR